ncbi:MAG: hypothetical protein ABIH68_03055 [bacterium]
MRTANPALNARTFEGFGHAAAAGDVMTIQGTVNKTGFLLLLLVISVLWTWKAYYTAGPGAERRKARRNIWNGMPLSD